MKRTICTTIVCLLCMAALFAQRTFTLKLRTSPQDGICEFWVNCNNGIAYSTSGYTHQIPAGTEVQVKTYKRPNYYAVLGQWKLTGWHVTQGAVTLYDYYYSTSFDGGGYVKFIMPESDVSLTALLEFNPDNPENPQSEGAWYPDEGLLVMDYMDGRDFNKTLRSLIPDESDYPLVRKVILAGHLNMNGGFSFLDKLQYLEHVDLSRLNGDTYYRIWSGDGRNKTWKELLLPASIGEIRSKAFEGTNLESFTIFATTPPTIGLDNEGHQNAFPSSEGMAVYVPEEALTLYANTAGWKDFNLQPIQEDGADITVNIDAAGRIADYQGMTLELKNVKSLYTRAMIITGRTAYTFPTLPKQTTYSIRLLSRTGSIVAHVDNVYLDQENIEVTMGSLKRLCSLNLQVKEGNKDIGTDRYSCLWLNQQGNVIGRNTQQDGLIENEPVRALITLTDPALTATYVSSDTIMVTPNTSLSTVSYQLKPIPTHRLTTVVQRADGKFMGQQMAKVSINKSGTGELVRQLSFSTLSSSGGVSSGEQEPLAEGDYEVTASVENSNLCIVTQHLHLFADQVLTFALSEANGSTVSLKWTHYGVAADGEVASATNMSATDGAISLRDVTNGVNLTGFTVTADGSLRLQEQLEPGTAIELTVGYRDGAQYAPAVQTAKADADGNVAFEMTTRDYGTLSVSFREAECSKVSIRLYDSKGQLATSGNAVTASKDFTLLKDDVYTVVLMEGGDMSKAMNSIADLQQYLTQDVDYITQQASVSSGKITTVAFERVPTLNPATFYTLDETRITPRLSQLTVGLIQTYSLCPKFKPEYKGRISDIKAVFTIPDDGSQQLIEGSVIMSNIKTDYTFTDGMLTVPVVEGQLLRFCVIPFETNDYTPMGKLTFMLDGEPCEQPLPATSYTVNGLELDVPPVVNTKEVNASGTAPANSPVTIIINGQETSTIMSDFNGKWNVTVPLADTYNMAQNDIYAQCVSPSGYKVKSPTSTVTYDRYSIKAQSVKMSYYNTEQHRNEVVIFDLEKGTWSPDYYYIYPGESKFEFTFDVTLNTADSTNIDEVLLYVYMNGNQQRLLFPKYNSLTGTWVATDIFSIYSLPKQVRAFVEEHSPKIIGEQVVSDCVHYLDNIADSFKEDPELTAITEQALNSQPGSAEEQEALRQLMIRTGTDPDKVMNSATLPDTPEARAQWEAEMDAALAAFDAIDADFNQLAAEGYFSFDITPLNELGQILGGYNFSKLSSSTRQYYEARARGEHPAAPAAGPNEEEYVVDLENGQHIYYRLHDDGYTIVIPHEDLQITCDYSAMDPEVVATVRELRQQMARLATLQQQAPYRAGEPGFAREVGAITKKILDLIDKINGIVSEIEAAVKVYIEGARKAIDANVEKIHDATMKAWDKFWAANAKWRTSVRLQNMKIRGAKGAEQLEKLRIGRLKLDKLSATWSKIGKVSKFLSIISLISDYKAFLESYEQLYSLYYSVPDPCKLEQAKADGLRRSIDNWGTARLVQKGFAIINDAASVASALAGILATITTAGTGVVFGGIGVGASFAISTANWVGNMASDYIWERKIKAFRKEIDELKCDTIPCEKQRLKFDDDKELTEVPNGTAGENGGTSGGKSGGCDDNPDCHKGRSTKKSGEQGGCPGPPGPPGGPRVLIDPSGYIYEAVTSNRVADATASIYYKELYEDMYGDSYEREVLWDAAKFDQVNPQLTDAEGNYGWDVPSGWWQVRVVKDGYVPTTSEWLPVPPPQLDVNLELQQPTPPVISRVVASEQGVELRFDKYMKPQHLTQENIFLTKNGQQIDGTIRLLNQEWTPDSARHFASRLLFSPATPLKLKEKVRLTVKAGVESYASVGMLQDFTQEFDVEEHVSELVADSVVGILHGEDYTLTVSAQPAAVAKGKKVTVRSLNPDIATVSGGSPDGTTELTLDQNGKATLTVQGKSYGTTALRLTLADDADVQTLTVVAVKDADNLITRKPTASLINGVEVAYGTLVRLQSETPGSVIYYTLDGTCPCENPKRLRYDGPYAITRDVVLKAIAVAPGFAESDVATFNYRVKHDPQSVTTAESIRINSSVYTLQGIKMKEGSQLKQGVYLIGNKKIVVK